MGELNSFICKTCGGRLDITTAVSGVLKCEFCGNLWTVPRPQTSAAARNFLNIGDHDLDTCKFDDAFEAFRRAAAEDENEPEAYFGMALAEFRVRQIKDEVEKRVQPICHIGSDKHLESKRFSDNGNFHKAMELATSAQRDEYRKRADEIDHIREEFIKLRDSSVDYDCFICVKVSEPGHENEEGINKTKFRTVDYKIADDIYYDLRGRGFKPFFSEREMGNRTGSDYEALILYALYSSECMIVVCTNEEYLKTPWVKNEYVRFSNMIAGGSDNKERDSITIVYKGTPIERLPGRHGKIQGIDIDSLDAINKVREYVDVHSPDGKKRREQEAAAKAEAERQKAEAEQRLIEEQEKLRKRFEEQNRMFEEKLSAIRSDESAATTGNATASSLLMRANQFLEFGDTSNAEDYFNRTLDINPNCGEAWWGLFLIEFLVKNSEELLSRIDCALAEKIRSHRYYSSALKYASGSFKQTVDDFERALTSHLTWWNKFLEEMGGSEDEIIAGINKATLQKIQSSNNYAFAWKYADGKFKEKLNKFKDALDDAPAHWNLFLEDMGAKNESELLPHITENTKNQIENNKHYKTAAKKAEGAFKTRIAEFQNVLFSGELWWKRFLEYMNVSDESKIYLMDDGEKLDGIQNNEFYINACLYANGELKEKISAFALRLNDYNIWIRCFFKKFGAKSYDGVYDSIEDVKKADIIASDEYLLRAVKFADQNQKAEADAFIAKINELKEHYERAQKYWQELIKEFGFSEEAELNNLLVCIDTSENYRKAIEYVKQSKDKAAYKHMTDFAAEQAKWVEKNRQKRDEKQKADADAKEKLRKEKLHRNLAIVMLSLLGCAMITLILAWSGVRPFVRIWYIWGSAFGAYRAILAMTIVSFILATALVIAGIEMLSNKRRKGVRYIYVIVSAVFLGLVLVSMAGVNIYSVVGGSNYDIGDGYFARYAKTDDGYSLKCYHTYGEDSSVVINQTFNDKPIVYIDSKAFFGQNEKVTSIEFADGDSTIVIGESAFSNFIVLKRVYIGSSVKEIGDFAFYDTSELNEVTLGVGLKRIGTKAFMAGVRNYKGQDYTYWYPNGRGFAMKYLGSAEQFEEIQKGNYWRHYAWDTNRFTYGWDWVALITIPVIVNDGTTL